MTEPIKIASGKFALYQTAKGAMHLSMQVDGESEPRHVEIPGMMVKMMMRKAAKDDAAGVSWDSALRTTVVDGYIPEEIAIEAGTD